MAYNYNGLCLVGDAIQNETRLWKYTTAVDNLATVEASGYFDPLLAPASDNITSLITDGNGIFISATDGNAWVSVTGVAPITTSSMDIPTGTLASGDIWVGSAGNAPVARALSGDVTVSNTGVTAIGANKVTSAMMADALLHYAVVPMTAAQWNAMYGAPFVLVAAPGANKMIVVDRAVALMTFVSAQYASGGAVALQYDSTVHGGGSAASGTVAAATVNGYAASTGIQLDGALSSVAFTAAVNKGLYISNATGAFTTGDSTWVVHVWYRIVPTV